MQAILLHIKAHLLLILRLIIKLLQADIHPLHHSQIMCLNHLRHNPRPKQQTKD
jgi:hypothetical protein